MAGHPGARYSSPSLPLLHEQMQNQAEPRDARTAPTTLLGLAAGVGGEGRQQWKQQPTASGGVAGKHRVAARQAAVAGVAGRSGSWPVGGGSGWDGGGWMLCCEVAVVAERAGFGRRSQGSPFCSYPKAPIMQLRNKHLPKKCDRKYTMKGQSYKRVGLTWNIKSGDSPQFCKINLHFFFLDLVKFFNELTGPHSAKMKVDTLYCSKLSYKMSTKYNKIDHVLQLTDHSGQESVVFSPEFW